MRMIAMIVALGLGAALAVPAEAGLKFSVRIGGGTGSASVQHGDGFKGGRRSHRRHDRRPGRRHHGSFPFPHHIHGDHSRRERRAEPVPAPPAPAPPVAVAPVEPPPPPDPHGPLRLTPARGVVSGAAPYVVGEALPGNLPHVTLDWRKFELPEPPPGRIYARVGRDVLVITAAGRVVESVLPRG